jgi:hypothetical protein
MDETVAYMMMAGDEEGGTVQPTQLVALQTEDGTQQLAVPVIDPTTGQVSSPHKSHQGPGQFPLLIPDRDRSVLLSDPTMRQVSSSLRSQHGKGQFSA